MSGEFQNDFVSAEVLVGRRKNSRVVRVEPIGATVQWWSG